MSNDFFWQYLDKFTGVSSTNTDQQLYDKGNYFASSLLSHVEHSMLRFSVSLRFYNPRLEMYRQLYSQVLETLPGAAVKNCRAWVSVNGQATCSTKDFPSLTLKTTEDEAYYNTEHHFDHIYPGSNSSSLPTVFLYGRIGEPETSAWNSYLRTYTDQNKIKYIFRYNFLNEVKDDSDKKESEGEREDENWGRAVGFGITLALKSTEYKVLDAKEDEGKKDDELDSTTGPVKGFDFAKLSSRWPQHASTLLSFKASLLAEEFDISKLKVWELEDLGIQASAAILSSGQPLHMLRDISQNLPGLAHTLAREHVDEKMKAKILEDADGVIAYRDLMWINDVAYDLSSIDPFVMFKGLAAQREGYTDLLKLGLLPGKTLFKLLAVPPSSQDGVKVSLDSKYIHYVNDLAADGMYARWSTSLDDILAYMPGQFHYVALNIYTLVMVVDPATKEGREQMLSMLNYMHQVPIRVGYLFVINDPLGEIIFKCFKAISEQNLWYGAQFISQLLQVPGLVDEQAIERTASNFLSGSFESVLKRTDWDEELKEVKEFISAKSLAPQTAFLNGHLLSDEGHPVNMAVRKVMELEPTIQEWVKNGKLTQSMVRKKGFNIHSWMLKQFKCPPIYPALIFPPKKEDVKYIPLDTLPEDLLFLSAPQERDIVKPVSHLVVGDLASPNVRQTIANGLARLHEEKTVEEGEAEEEDKLYYRLGWIHSADSKEGKAMSDILRTLLSLSLKATNKKAEAYLKAVNALLALSADHPMDLASLRNVITPHLPQDHKPLDIIEEEVKNLSTFLDGLTINQGDAAIISNGRVIVFPQERVFSRDEWDVLTPTAYSVKARAVTRHFDQLSFNKQADFINSDYLSLKLMQISAFLSSSYVNPAEMFKDPPTHEPSFSVKPEFSDPSTTDLDISVIVDPIGEKAQKVSSILIALTSHFTVNLSVYLRTPRKLSDLPLKNFYRYVLDSMEFSEDGNISSNYAVANFLNLPQKRLLSMTVESPGSWMISSHSCTYDLDNIILEKLPSQESILRAQFVLDNLLIQGSCTDLATGEPPRALELVLSDATNPHVQDSLVMSNLGYFQLKASPNIWKVELAEGQSNDIYKIEGPTGEIIVDSWIGDMRYLHVNKRPGMEEMGLFDDHNSATDDEKAERGFLDSLSDLLGEKKQKAEKEVVETKTEDDTIHIFSLASGHLYERFLKVMMVSVVSNTKSPVKFWLLSNFLSPQFKSTVTDFAAKNNFEVELVTYKWPEWLNQQTEKQRIIWGYKILFLDVLFPVNLTKVIYVDADQIVRTDMKELMNFDLEGAPYGYTPFCSSQLTNPTTKGFRFWDSGFWASHLDGKPYHISALYVVDLYQLRKTAAADRLRATYNSLSRDPNSLANLDQDLPNYLQHQIPIKSLPENWLWCETWCTMESRDDAKTIDLCNNPLTKLPKLEAAAKFVPEWSKYESIVRAFEEELEKGQGEVVEKVDL